VDMYGLAMTLLLAPVPKVALDAQAGHSELQPACMAVIVPLL
jgi:hypothetical protein